MSHPLVPATYSSSVAHIKITILLFQGLPNISLGTPCPEKYLIAICRFVFLTHEVCFWPRFISSLCCPARQILCFGQPSGKEWEGVIEQLPRFV